MAKLVKINLFSAPGSGGERLLPYIEAGIRVHDFSRNWAITGHSATPAQPLVATEDEVDPLAGAEAAIFRGQNESDEHDATVPPLTLQFSRIRYAWLPLFKPTEDHVDLEIQLAKLDPRAPDDGAPAVITWRVEWQFQHSPELTPWLSAVRRRMGKKRRPIIVAVMGYESHMLASQEQMNQVRTRQSGVSSTLTAFDPPTIRQAIGDVLHRCSPLLEFVTAMRALGHQVHLIPVSLLGMINGDVNLLPEKNDGNFDSVAEPFRYAIYDPENRFGIPRDTGDLDRRDWFPVLVADPFLGIAFGVRHDRFVDVDEVVSRRTGRVLL